MHTGSMPLEDNNYYSHMEGNRQGNLFPIKLVICGMICPCFVINLFPWLYQPLYNKTSLLMIYEINHIWTAEMKWKWRNDRRSERNLCNCVKKPKKKFRTSTGFALVTSRLPVRCSTNWVMKPLTLGAGQYTFLPIRRPYWINSV